MEIKSNLAWQTLLVVSALVFGVMAALCKPQQVSSAVITQVEVVRAGEKTVVRVTANRPLVSQTMRLSGPERLVLDFSGARLASLRSFIPSAFSPVHRVRAGQFKPDVARVVIDLEQVVPYRVRSEEKGVTVEFDVGSSAPVRSAPAPAPPADQAQRLARMAEANAPAPRAVADTNSTPRSDPSLPRAAPPARSPSPENAAAPFENSFESGMLTFRAQNQPLRSVLRQIGDQAGVRIYLAEGLGNEQISAEFQHYRLDEALRQILKNYDAFFLYGEGRGILDSAALQAVWVYAAGRGQALRPLPEITSTTAKEAAPMQTGSDIGPRAEPVTGPKGSDSVAEVLKALEDPRDDVREQALSRALIAKAQIPQETLVNLALEDKSAKVRLLALQALPLDPDLRWVAERAADDSNQSVSQLAREVLRVLNLH